MVVKVELVVVVFSRSDQVEAWMGKVDVAVEVAVGDKGSSVHG